ncbi:thermonuclease family protein [Parasphingorhabdus sp. JC815]|uniref:thermonuclease family protein n=1 Tax=Parasphingorhabdus sp. JC815 TaxID=3232140 RepID=UPI00345A4022
MLLIVALLISCHAIDGDTLRCGDERIRLLAIDAPEMGGKCRGRTGRVCVDGDPDRAKAHLARLIGKGRLRIDRTGKDRYGRTVAVVYAGGVNVACSMLAAGDAVYQARYDQRGRVKRECGVD